MRTCLCLLTLALAASAHADPLIYEGHLGGADPFAEVDLRFALYDAAAEGEAIWTSDPIAVALDDGRFVAEIEAGPAGALQPRHFAGPRWLQVTVLPAAGGEVPLAPRQRIGRVPLSFDGMTLSGPDGTYVMRVDCPDVDDPDDVPLAGHYASIHDALAWLADKRIAADSTVEIQVISDCVVGEPIRLAHPDGARIHIVGARIDRAPAEPDLDPRPELSFDGDGVLVEDGAELGMLAGFNLLGPGEAGYGIAATNGGRVTVADVSLSGFDRCVTASYGGIIEGSRRDGPVTATTCGTGFIASSGGIVRLSYPRADGSRGSGFRAVHNGTLTAVHAVASDGDGHGFTADRGGTMYADYSYAHDNDGYGFVVHGHGSMDASVSTAERNHYGYVVQTHGYLGASASYSIENRTSALWASDGGLLSFPCTERDERQEELNPRDGPPPAQSIIDNPNPAPDDEYEAIYSIEEALIRANGCPGPADGVSIHGSRPARGHLEHPDAP